MVKREKLADIAHRKLEEMIVTLKLKPGGLLSEADLCEQLEIGRTPIREALQRLETERLVDIQPRRSIIVSDINAADMIHVIEARKPLEMVICKFAAIRATASERELLAGQAKAMREAAIARDIDEFMRIDKETDRILGEASRNHYASQACQPLQSLCRRFWYYYQGLSELEHAANMHHALLAAVINEDEEQAISTNNDLLGYLENSIRKLL